MQHDVLEWHDETEQLPPITLTLFKAAQYQTIGQQRFVQDSI